MAEQEKIRHIIRVANTDIPGEKKLGYALRSIKGINYMMAHAICVVSGLSEHKKAGTLTDAEVKKITDILENPFGAGIPKWFANRKKDLETGEDMHLIGNDLIYQQDSDIKLLKKIKCYRGVRHMFGATLRGQRTKSNFRKKKGRGGKALGVKRAKKGKAG